MRRRRPPEMCRWIPSQPLPRLLVFVLLLLLVVEPLLVAAAGDAAERWALLQFKASVSSDPAGLLSRWSDTAADHCSWPGVDCDGRSRVVSLNISAKGDAFLATCRRSGPVWRHCPDSVRRLTGVISAALGGLKELKVLSLPFHAFSGEVPPEIWALGKLEVVDFEGNALSGSLPSTFPRGLRVLNLSSNMFKGEIPLSISNCEVLETLDLNGNQLNGTIPGFLGRLVNLRELYLSFNQLGGSIPNELGAGCRSLEHLDVSANFLVGSIPRKLGNCRELRSLLLFSNLFDDVLPVELGLLSKLQTLDVSDNCLSGPVPKELGGCIELSVLVLSNPYERMTNYDDMDHVYIDDFNLFQGGIVENITTLPKLRVLWAPRANLNGLLPTNWGSCEKLEMLNLGGNFFSGSIPGALMECHNVKFLNLSSNKLTGFLSEGLQVPCMDVFDVSSNNLSGSIPKFIPKPCPSSDTHLDHLSSAYISFFTYMSLASVSSAAYDFSVDITQYHNFEGNSFTEILSSLPVSDDRLRKKTVYAFMAAKNNIFGQLSDDFFGKCKDLSGLIINLNDNWISGVLPVELGVICKPLVAFSISGNRLAGLIPQSIGLLEGIMNLDLSRNQFQGEIPVSFNNLGNLHSLLLSTNHLNGTIPVVFGQMHGLSVLDLSSNSLSGEIPKGLMDLRNLTVLLLDHNKLSGEIPSGLANMNSLLLFNVSFNNLSGSLPMNASSLGCDSVLENPLVSCHVYSLDIPPSDPLGHSGNSQAYADTTAVSPPNSSSSTGFNPIEIASIASSAAIVSVLLALVALYVYTKKCTRRVASQPSGSREVTLFMDIGVRITIETVVRATGNFNASNCIGSGGFGATYKAEISPGVVVAIKRLSIGRFQGVQQFHAEIKTLGRWRHPNLVTLIGYHLSESDMFLIYNYLPGGNLERFIHERHRRPVDWRMLHKIAQDVACALAYLHDDCVPRILHRDVKPSNILLDDDYNAYLSDFGLARLLGNSETHVTTGVAGTFGYVAPEYAMTCRVSDKADVYSYGVVLMELISDKKALDPSFSPYGNGFNIVAWACMLLRQGRAREFFTEDLWHVGPHDDLVETLHLAVMCTVESLSVRPTMRQVVQRLKQLQPPTC